MSRRTLGLIVVAAGSSTRMDGIDKVWALLGPRPVVWHSLVRLLPASDAAVLVVREDSLDRAYDELGGEFPGLRVVPGGRERQESVRRGLAVLPQVDLVAVHDGARPLAPRRLIEAGMACLESAHGAIPVVPVTDTIKTVDEEGTVTATLDRATLRAVQTPQLFEAAALRQVHEASAREYTFATDDASLLERAGFAVASFPGDTHNLKITTPLHLQIAQLLLRTGAAA